MPSHVSAMPVPCQSHVSCKKLEGQLIAILIIAKYSALLLALILPDLSDVIINSYRIFLSEMSLVSVILYSASSLISKLHLLVFLHGFLFSDNIFEAGVLQGSTCFSLHSTDASNITSSAPLTPTNIHIYQ